MAPLVTLAIVRLTELSTTISTTGVVTLGADPPPEASDLDFVVKTTTITAAPTVVALTALTTVVTSTPISTATTFASCDVCGEACTSPDTYCWAPPATKTAGSGGGDSATCPAVGEPVTETVTETVTAAGGGGGKPGVVTVAGPTAFGTVTVTSTVATATVTVAAAEKTTTATAAGVTAYATITVTSTLAAATVTLPPVADTVTSFVTVSGLGYNRTVSVTTQANATTVTLTSTLPAVPDDVTLTETVTASPSTSYLTVTSTAPAVTDDVTLTETITASALTSDCLDVVHHITASPSVSISSAACSASSSSSVMPTFACDKYGYLIQGKALYQVDISTGDYNAVTTDVGTPGNVNAMGYNVLDNYLYGHGGVDNALRRIASDGTTEVVLIMDNTISGLIADVDTEGNYWYGTSGATSWYQYDLNPYSSTYGTVLSSGTTTSSGRGIFDWVVIPETGRFLWTIGTASPSGGADLMKWSMDTHTWTVVKNYPSISTAQFGALYGINNGTIYASDNASGYIWAFDTAGVIAPYVVSDGPISSANDGARCVLNTSV